MKHVPVTRLSSTNALAFRRNVVFVTYVPPWYARLWDWLWA